MSYDFAFLLLVIERGFPRVHSHTDAHGHTGHSQLAARLVLPPNPRWPQSVLQTQRRQGTPASAKAPDPFEQVPSDVFNQHLDISSATDVQHKPSCSYSSASSLLEV